MPRSTQAQVALIAGLLYLLVGLALVAVLIAGVSSGGVEFTSPLLLGVLTVGVFALAARLFRLARSPRLPPASPPVASQAAQHTVEGGADGEDTAEELPPQAADSPVPRPRGETAVERTRPHPHPNARQLGGRG